VLSALAALLLLSRSPSPFSFRTIATPSLDPVGQEIWLEADVVPFVIDFIVA